MLSSMRSFREDLINKKYNMNYFKLDDNKSENFFSRLESLIEKLKINEISSFDIERGMRLYNKKPKTEKTPVVSGVQESIDQTGSTFVPTSDAQPSITINEVDALGTTKNTVEDTIERQRETAREAARKAATERRKDERREEREKVAKYNAKLATQRKASAGQIAKRISKDVKGKGAKALGARPIKGKSSGPFAKGGLAGRK